jgi:hypothetical protein
MSSIVEYDKPLIVGYAFMSKKARSMSTTLEEDAAAHGLLWRPIDLDLLTSGNPLADQGPFDIVIHKLSEDIHEVNKLDTHHENSVEILSHHHQRKIGAVNRISAIEEYGRTNPLVPIVDQPSCVARVVSRITTCELLAQLNGTLIGTSKHESSMNRRLVAPKYVVAQHGVSSQTAQALENALMKKSIFSGPLLCKPAEACGPGASHMLTILLDKPTAIFTPHSSTHDDNCASSPTCNHGECDDVKICGMLPWLSQPTVVQEYVNHNGILLKVYVIGEKVRFFVRQSLPNLPGTDLFSTSSQSQLDGVGMKRPLTSEEEEEYEEEEEEEGSHSPSSSSSGQWSGDGEVEAVEVDFELAQSAMPKGMVLFESQKPYPTLHELWRESGFDFDQLSAVEEGSDVASCQDEYHNNPELLDCIQDAAAKVLYPPLCTYAHHRFDFFFFFVICKT